jgi:hypothetical protein
MKAPFDYGKVITQEHFTNRTHEVRRLENNFINRTNTTLISPRRWGKSSLVKYTADRLARKDKHFKVCYLDLFNVVNEDDFYRELSLEVMKATSGKFEEFMQGVKKFLGTLKPTITLGNELNKTSFELEIGFKEIRKNITTLLDLPEKVAKAKNIILIVCIDEFQNIEKFSEPEALQKKLRAHWQHHQHVVYCIYGSKRHMMMHLFESKSMPFYKFGDTFYLEKIKSEHWIPYITGRFVQSKKKITEAQAAAIVSLMQEHPYYVQQLCQIVWTNTERSVNDEVMNVSIEELLGRNAALFQRDFEMLSETQINFLKALAAGEKNFSSKAVLDKYRIGTSANIPRVTGALEGKEIIDRLGKQIGFTDPAFELFFKRLYKIN